MENSFASFLILPVICIYAIFFVLLYLFKKKGGVFPDNVKSRIKYLILAFLAVGAWQIFFEDSKIAVTCDAETKVCSYYRSTIANKELRFVRTYDLSETVGVSVEKHKHYSGRGRSDTYYKIVFENGDGGIDFPKTFSFESDAAREAEKIRRFLSGEKKNYGYFYERGGSDGEFLSLMGLTFLMIAGIVGAAVITGLMLRQKTRQ